jgi:fatty acid amide hydrolase 2
LPLGVQVAAGPGRDHVSIAVAQLLEREFGGWVPPAITGSDRS